MRYHALFAAVMGTLTAAGPGAAQEYRSPTWGGTGGTSGYDLDCGPGNVMVGAFGKVGQWIDGIGLHCQQVKPDGTLGSTSTRGPKGGSGGDGAEAKCPAGKVVGAITAYTGSFVNGLVLNCFPWSAASRRPDYSAGTAPMWLGSAAYSRNARVVCPAEKAAKALRGKYGWYIDSVQFICDDWDK